MAKKILVLGNSNVDFVLKIPRFHDPGETILAESLVTFFGGKGANQAITAKRLGGKVQFITKLGTDDFGKAYRQVLVRSGLNGKAIIEDRKLGTGTAVIEVNPEGENRIVSFLGANGSLSASDLQKLKRYFSGAGIFVTQLEIPLSTAEAGLKMAKDQGATTLLNPSPPVRLSSKLLSLVDFIVPNESEAEVLTCLKWKRDQHIPKIAEKLLEMGPNNVVMTLGSKGLYFKNSDEEFWMKAFKVKVVDTTAAGDAFLGALAVSLSENKSIREALRFANGAGALSTTKFGAQPSLPFRKDLDRFLSRVVRSRG